MRRFASCARPDTTWIGSLCLTPSPGIVGLSSKPYCPVAGVAPASERREAFRAATVAGRGRLLTSTVAVTVGARERTSAVNAPSTPRSVPTTLR